MCLHVLVLQLISLLAVPLICMAALVQADLPTWTLYGFLSDVCGCHGTVNTNSNSCVIFLMHNVAMVQDI